MTVATHRTVHVEHVMGTAVSFHVRDHRRVDEALTDACVWLHTVDRTYSRYRLDSVISRLDRGDLLPRDADQEVNDVLSVCAMLNEQTGGAFDVRATGRLDPSAYVKGWAAERAAQLLEAHGLQHFQINAGGDIVVRGDADQPGEGWRIGIRHPDRPDALAAVARLHDRAIATSARYERGAHIVDPTTSRPADGSRSVSVVAANLGLADAWATALFAAGPRLHELLAARDDVQALIIDRDSLMHTDGFPLSTPPSGPR